MNVAGVVKDWLLIAFSWSVIKDTAIVLDQGLEADLQADILKYVEDLYEIMKNGNINTENLDWLLIFDNCL
ncbi:hypothetical protein L1987_14252 [Smallanthus sonchifolius]|uniref:Uncharacterized protein n=1 Tax=Smallanthus sonchifolius TaxID=185202 RepID=A0ACB9J2Q7_9ASTR|nr:hypothetical protein L1987_14252 [Smallanthus sonchifolius]